MRLLFASLSLVVSFSALAAEPASSPSKITAAQFLASLHFQDGKITLPAGIATLNLPANFHYLPPADTEKLLVQGWGNPPGPETSKTLGMIVPTNVDPLSPEGWAVVVTYDKDGHVKDNDADSINYTDLLKDMKESTAEGNKERKEHGYAPMTLVGWAEAPHYDKTQHKLYWAKQLHTDGGGADALNYNVRVLGREGVLVLNAVASVAQIAQIKSEMQNVTVFTDFTPGNRYADFDGKTDKVAEYGLAALVAGGVAAKLGVFGKLFAILLAFKKIILLGFAACASWVYKLFGRKKKTGTAGVDLGK
jgi:uncharacterized membrane-anchored protein